MANGITIACVYEYVLLASPYSQIVYNTLEYIPPGDISIENHRVRLLTVGDEMSLRIN